VLKVEGDSEEMEAIEGGGLLQLPCLRWLVTHADIGDSGGGGGGGRALPLEVVVVDEMTEAVAGGAGWSPFRLLDEDGTSEETSVLLD
jgi:hypothetical protein